ncbi:MAG: hypothetical protein ACODAU_11640 [Myxococcota bacterium]
MQRSDRRLGGALAAVSALALLLVPSLARAQPPPPPKPPPRLASPEVRTIGQLVVTSGVGGHFADASCRGGATLAPAPIARTLEWVRREAEATDSQPLLYDTGSLLAPHGVARFTATKAPETLARMVDSLGYQALAFGEAELAAPRDAILGTINALRDRSVPVIATNLYCGRAASHLCEALVDGTDGISVHRIGGEKVAFIAMLAPSALERVSPERTRGVRIAPVEAAMAAAVREARDLGADIVIASVDEGAGGTGSAHLLELGGKLPEDGKPDLLLGARAGDQFLFARPLGFRPAVAAAPPGGAARVRMRRNILVDTFDVLVSPVPYSKEPHPAVGTLIDEVGDAYCGQWGRRLAGGTMAPPLGGQAVLDLAAGTARVAADAELALLPTAILDPAWRPAAEDELTASDVYVALKQDEPLLVASVEGTWLQQVAKGNLAKQFTIPGLEVEDGSVKVNGRSVEPRAEYRVVTVRPATVAPHALPAGPTWKAMEGTTLRSAMLDFLQVPRDEDPREALPNPAHRPEWTFRTEVRGTFAGSYVNNPDRDGDGSGDYEETQLQRATAATYGYQATLRADAVARNWGWDNVLDSRYQLTKLVGADDAEGVDLTSLRSTFRYRGLYVRREQFYMPEPFLETYLETELTVPEDRSFRHMLVRPTLGLQFTLTKHLSFKLLGGFEREALEPGGKAVPGAGAQLVLKPWTLMKTDDRSITLEGNADYFASDLGGRHTQTLRGNFKARYQLNSVLAFGWDLELFVIRDDERGTGVSTVNSAFIQLGWIGRAINP